MPKNETKSGAAKAAKEKKAEEAVVEEAVATAEVESEEEAPEAVESDSELVEVSKEDLRKFMTRLEDVEADNKRLIEASDKARMAAISERERGEQTLLPRVKLTRMGGPTGRLVIAWKMTENESYVDGNRLVEKQEIELFYHDGKSEKMPLITFYRQQNKHTIAEILSRTQKLNDTKGGEMLKVKIVGTTEEIDIDLNFVN